MRRRIAFIDYFPTHYRIGLYEDLARRMEVDFIFFSDERERWQSAAIKAAADGDYRRLDLRRTRIAGQSVTPGIVGALGSRRYDAVVKTLNGKLMLPLTYLTAKRRGVPFVLWTGMWHHPTTAVHRLSQPLTYGVYRGADAIVAYGEHVKRFLGGVRGVDPAKVHVAGQAVQPSRFENVERQVNGRADVLFVGQLKEYKGVTPLLDAFAQLRDHPARLRMVGSGPLEGEVRRRLPDLGNVELLGHVPQSALPAEMARATCLVLPSVTTPLDREPWGVVVNEAMHAGLPVVASSAVGAAAGGLVQDGRNGFVVPENDASALASALRRLLSDPALAGRMSAAARDDVRAFTYARMGQAFEDAVEYAVAARARRVG
jgi:glycosyltransferase involved in cell wall biosynthesis